MSFRFVRVTAVAVFALFAGVAQSAEAQPTQLPPEVLFAREFVRVLRDSGSVGVIPMTVPRTRALNGYAPNMDALRDNFAPAQTTVTLDRWNVVPEKGEVPQLFLVVFKVEGVVRPVELSLYVETIDDRLLLNTIRTQALAAREQRVLQ